MMIKDGKMSKEKIIKLLDDNNIEKRTWEGYRDAKKIIFKNYIAISSKDYERIIKIIVKHLEV